MCDICCYFCWVEILFEFLLKCYIFHFFILLIILRYFFSLINIIMLLNTFFNKCKYYCISMYIWYICVYKLANNRILYKFLLIHVITVIATTYYLFNRFIYTKHFIHTYAYKNILTHTHKALQFWEKKFNFI